MFVSSVARFRATDCLLFSLLIALLLALTATGATANVQPSPQSTARLPQEVTVTGKEVETAGPAEGAGRVQYHTSVTLINKSQVDLFYDYRQTQVEAPDGRVNTFSEAHFTTFGKPGKSIRAGRRRTIRVSGHGDKAGLNVLLKFHSASSPDDFVEVKTALRSHDGIHPGWSVASRGFTVTQNSERWWSNTTCTKEHMNGELTFTLT